MAAVGAVNVFRSPWNGYQPPEVRAYSSAGPTPILFDSDGNHLEPPAARDQPQFMGPDGVATTFFELLKPIGVWRFPGTSTAALHIAAVAALMLEYNRTLSRDEIYAVLDATAVGMSVPGFDNTTGYGFVDALRALTYVEMGGNPENSTR